jgi:hypothetical protein
MSEIITIVVVRLSSAALRKNVTMLISHISAGWLVVRIREVMTSKPLWASTTSTIVIAPIRKNTTWDVAASDSDRFSTTRSWSPLISA